MEVKDIEGVLKELKQITTKSNKNCCIAKVNTKAGEETWFWWNLADATASKLIGKSGIKVKGTGEVKGDYRNLKNLEAVDKILPLMDALPVAPVEAVKEEWNGFSFGLACKLALMQLQHSTQISENEYKKTVKDYYKWNKELTDELR